MLLLWVVQLAAAIWSKPANGYRTRSLILNSAFIKQNSKLRLTESSAQCQLLEDIDHRESRIYKIRGGGGGGAYDDYNNGYNYNDEMVYNDDYRSNDYEREKSYSNTPNRYEDDYHPRKSSGDGYYDDEGRYFEDYDDRGGVRSVSVTVNAILFIESFMVRSNWCLYFQYYLTSNPPQRRSPSASQSKLPAVLTSGNRKLGIIFLSSGAAFTALGITLFFNKTLMRLGNLLFVCGIPLMIGPGRTLGYFLQPKKARATGCLACGIFLVLVGHPVIGILLEVFGLLNLFGNMFPVLMIMAKNLPVVGTLFGGGGNSSERRREKRREEDYYNDDDRYYNNDHGREREQWQSDY